MTKLSDLIKTKPLQAIGYVVGGIMGIAALLAVIVMMLDG